MIFWLTEFLRDIMTSSRYPVYSVLCGFYRAQISFLHLTVLPPSSRLYKCNPWRLSLCLSVCLSAGNFTYKLLNGSLWKFFTIDVPVDKEELITFWNLCNELNDQKDVTTEKLQHYNNGDWTTMSPLFTMDQKQTNVDNKQINHNLALVEMCHLWLFLFVMCLLYL